MKDRQPGAPGQYKAIIDAVELQKMQSGEQFVITMTRDDQPLVEGTPYNKASVLPDDLATLICPDVLDPTPADALNRLRKRKYAAVLSATGWVESGGMYTQGISIADILGDDAESVKSWPVYSGDKAAIEAVKEAAAIVTFANTSAGTVTFTCLEEMPTVDIPVIVEVSR